MKKKKENKERRIVFFWGELFLREKNNVKMRNKDYIICNK
jgi:hypothetical protein